MPCAAWWPQVTRTIWDQCIAPDPACVPCPRGLLGAAGFDACLVSDFTELFTTTTTVFVRVGGGDSDKDDKGRRGLLKVRGQGG